VLGATNQFAGVSPALAQTHSIHIPSGLLSESIRRLSDRTGVSIGFAGRLPNIVVREVRGAPTALKALDQMLEGTAYRAVATGPSSFRIELAPEARQRTVPARSLGSDEAPAIIVTALKRPKALSRVPATAHVLRGAYFRPAAGLAGSDAIGQEIPSLTISSLGPGLNRLFLRGIGDGPLNGFNQGSVAILLDEARINFDAPDPDWALIDIDQAEVLEGPQGPLYGTGALGGIVKISTNHPDLERKSAQIFLSTSVGHDSHFSNAQSFILNLPLASSSLGIRAVGYRDFQGGWIDNARGASDINRERLIGGRMAVRWLPADRWTVDLLGAIQNRGTRDSQYVDGDLGPLERPDRLREPRDLDAKQMLMTVKGPIGAFELTSITSLSRQEAAATYDATPLASTLGTIGPTSVKDDRNYRLLDQEVRIQNRNFGWLEWLAGLSFVNATTKIDVVASDTNAKIPLLTMRRSVSEAAGFVEASARIGNNLSVGGGARVFSVGVDDEGEESDSSGSLKRKKVRSAGDASVTWNPAAGRTTFFVRAATGYRPGGMNVQSDASQQEYDADELVSIELGSRINLSQTMSAEATLYAARWQHVQTDELLSNGLIATRNAGNARNYGVEGDIRWDPLNGTTVTGGFMLQSARLESSGENSLVDDRRLPAVPELAARLKVDHNFRWGAWNGQAGVGGRYVGATHLSFDPVLDRRTPGHAVMDAHVSLSRNEWTAELSGENLTNSTADTFAFGNPYRVRSEPQRTPARPRSIGIVISRTF